MWDSVTENKCSCRMNAPCHVALRHNLSRRTTASTGFEPYEPKRLEAAKFDLRRTMPAPEIRITNGAARVSAQAVPDASQPEQAADRVPCPFDPTQCVSCESR